MPFPPVSDQEPSLSNRRRTQKLAARASHRRGLPGLWQAARHRVNLAVFGVIRPVRRSGRFRPMSARPMMILGVRGGARRMKPGSCTTSTVRDATTMTVRSSGSALRRRSADPGRQQSDRQHGRLGGVAYCGHGDERSDRRTRFGPLGLHVLSAQQRSPRGLIIAGTRRASTRRVVACRPSCGVVSSDIGVTGHFDHRNVDDVRCGIALRIRPRDHNRSWLRMVERSRFLAFAARLLPEEIPLSGQVDPLLTMRFNRQPVATHGNGLAYFGRSPARRTCHRLRPVATTGLHRRLHLALPNLATSGL
jgi:hypothetical protein